jgi:tRNA(adenine34) deaminase
VTSAPHPPEYFMREALRVARVGLERDELPIGAVVVLDGHILATAHTAERAERRLLVHAELLALETADRLRPFPGQRRAVQLFTTLEPCLMCFGAAISFGLGEIHYALESPGDGAVGLVQGWQRDAAALPSYRPPRLHGGLLRAESIALFKDYVSRHTSGGMWEWARTLVAREDIAPT